MRGPFTLRGLSTLTPACTSRQSGSSVVPVRKPLVVHVNRGSFDVYIGRPSSWGNPFSHLPNSAAEFRVGTRTEAIEAYEKWLLEQPDLVERVKRELRSKILGFWCKPLACHG